MHQNYPFYSIKKNRPKLLILLRCRTSKTYHHPFQGGGVNRSTLPLAVAKFGKPGTRSFCTPALALDTALFSDEPGPRYLPAL